MHGGRGLLTHDRRALLTKYIVALRINVPPGFGPLVMHKFVQFLVEVFLILDRLDEAILDLNETVLLNREAADFNAVEIDILSFRIKHGRWLIET